MEIFIDTSNITEIERWMRHGVVDGVTTNPSIMLRDGHRDLESGAKAIAALVEPRPVSIEVVTNDLDEMLDQGRKFASWAPNIVVKVPIVNEAGEPCLRVIRALARDSIRVNCTACLSFGQAILAAKAGATYVSLFGGRIADEGNDPARVIGMTRAWLDRWNVPARIIVGSIRGVGDIQVGAAAGADIITIPPPFLAKMADHKYSRETVREFVADGRAAFDAIRPPRGDRRV